MVVMIKKTGSFSFATNSLNPETNAKEKHLSGDDLVAALQATCAHKIMLIVDACHAGGLDVKDDPIVKLETLAQGSGMMVLGACDKNETTPGSSPLTCSVLAALKQTRQDEILSAQILSDRVKSIMRGSNDSDSDVDAADGTDSIASTAIGHAAPVFYHAPGAADFMLAGGMNIVAKCIKPQGACPYGQQQIVKKLGYNNFRLTSRDFKLRFRCHACQHVLQLVKCHFNSCHYRVNYAVLVDGGPGCDQVTV